MSETVIKAEGLGKKYTIGHQSDSERYHALRDVMARNLKGLWQNARDIWSGKDVIQGEEVEEFWALKDVSFEIKRGEAVGIIGRNGAGKSTLLKVLSRITEPSAGKVTIKGRIASLLEVGTGFHPELTGRENIFLNGAILGMSRKEIKSKFDEIVDFAEVEKFLDTPVKRYSSGMYVRLAFAVAAHLEPEILLVDEVLAVGDAEFQKKCLGKMEVVAASGRTILFVSHNMGAIRSLCGKVVLIKSGCVEIAGPTAVVIFHYLDAKREVHKGKVDLSDAERNPKYSPLPSITEAWIERNDGTTTYDVFMGMPLKVCFSFKCARFINNPVPGFLITNSLGETVTYITSQHAQTKFPDSREGTFIFAFQEIPLMPGNYYITLQLYENVYDYCDIVFGAMPLRVLAFSQEGTNINYKHGGSFYIRAKQILLER